MTATSPVNAIQYPDLTNVKDQVAQFSTLKTNIDTSSAPLCANASDRTTRIPSPIEGQMAFLATENILTYYNGTAWVAAEMEKTILKTVTEQITAATTTLNADDVLYFYADANSEYMYELGAIYLGDNTQDAIKAGWTGPAGATKKQFMVVAATGVTNLNSCTIRVGNVAMGTTSQQGTHTTAGAPCEWWEKGTIKTTTAGLVQFQWGKPAAYSTALQVLAGSYLSYRKIS